MHSVKSICTVIALVATTQSVLAEQTITVMTYTGTYQDRYAKAVIDPFRAANPDIKVQHFPVTNSAQMLGLMRAQKASPQIDIAILDVSVAKAATDEGLFVKLDETNIPSIKDLVPEARVPEVAGVGHTLDSLVMVYSAEAFPEPPKAWMEMADAKNKKKVAMLGMPDIQSLGLLLVLNRANGGGTDPQNYEKGIAALGEIAPNVLTWDPKPEIFQAIASGQVAMGTAWNARAQVNIDLSNQKIKATSPKEGSVMQIDTINLVANGPNSDAAKKFINYALGQEAQKSFAEAMFYIPTNSKVVVSDVAKTRSGRAPNILPVDWIAVAKVREGITEQWRRKVIPLSR